VSLTLRALLLGIFFSVFCQAQTRTLALYAVPPGGLDAEVRPSRILDEYLQPVDHPRPRGYEVQDDARQEQSEHQS